MVFVGHRGWKATNVNYLEYIETDGTQYIDTGFKPNNDTTILSEFDIINTSCHVFGARNSYLSKAFALFWLSESSLSVQMGDQTYPGGTFTMAGRHEVEMTSTTLTIDDVITATYNPLQFQCEQNAWLMSCYGSSASEYAKGKLYHAALYDGPTMIRDYYPSKDPDGVACLYDQVNREYVYNAGTGLFVAGPEL